MGVEFRNVGLLTLLQPAMSADQTRFHRFIFSMVVKE
jgi:hypothetical protein